MNDLKFVIKIITPEERAKRRAAAEEFVRLITRRAEALGISVDDACRAMLHDAIDGESFTDLIDAAEDREPIANQKNEKDFWRESARYTRELERARAQAYRLMMKHHKAREVMRFKRQKRIYGGLM